MSSCHDSIFLRRCDVRCEMWDEWRRGILRLCRFEVESGMLGQPKACRSHVIARTPVNQYRNLLSLGDAMKCLAPLQVMADYCKFCNLKGKHVDFKMIRSGLISLHLAVSQSSCWLPGTPPSRWCWIPSSLTRLLISSLTMKPFEVAVASSCQSIHASQHLTALNSTALHRSWVGFLCLGQWLLSLDDQMASCQSRGGVFQSHWKRLKGKGYIEGCYDKAHGVFSRPWSWNLFLLTGLGNLGTTWKLIFQRQGHENLQRIKETLAAGDNVVLMANHQTEADPQVGKE